MDAKTVDTAAARLFLLFMVDGPPEISYPDTVEVRVAASCSVTPLAILIPDCCFRK
jgi:hypothetical protein